MSAQQDAGFYEAEMHGAIVEADPETCKDIMKEMEEWKPEIEKTYSQKLMSESTAEDTVTVTLFFLTLKFNVNVVRCPNDAPPINAGLQLVWMSR
ncbi:hypothetical protein BD769DRAFT_1668382 [Suillus cothurnatus]|nr:hypothetical protein BD769DRAFT_1668382 [Suillus cothurnatus]